MRPGTQVEIRQGMSVLGSGEASDGSLWVYIPDGLPKEVNDLVVAQTVCPKPPPPPLTDYRFESTLRTVEPNPFKPGDTVPAPKVTTGLTACSRALYLTGVIPGAEIYIEGAGGWWHSEAAGDRTELWLPLPVALKENSQVLLRQAFSRRCELKTDRAVLHVGPQKTPGKPLRSV